jgi:hypothetical protein
MIKRKTFLISRIRSESGTVEKWNRIMIMVCMFVPEQVRKWIPVEAEKREREGVKEKPQWLPQCEHKPVLAKLNPINKK